MKKVFIYLLLLISISANAQNVKSDGKPYAFYCQVEAKFTVSKIRVEILFDDKNVCNEKGEKIEFKSMYDGINYMSKRGWDYVDCVDYKNALHFILRKYVTKDEEATEGLYFEGDFK